jgi:hypothetical protein
MRCKGSLVHLVAPTNDLRASRFRALVKAHFNSGDDGGWFAGHYGERICEWTYDPGTREIDVRCPGNIHGKRVQLPMSITGSELKNRLAQLAIELAGKILDKNFDV